MWGGHTQRQLNMHAQASHRQADECMLQGAQGAATLHPHLAPLASAAAAACRTQSLLLLPEWLCRACRLLPLLLLLLLLLLLHTFDLLLLCHAGRQLRQRRLRLLRRLGLLLLAGRRRQPRRRWQPRAVRRQK